MKIQDAVTFNRFYQKVSDMKMPVRAAYKLMQINSNLQNDLIFFQERLQKILQECGEKDKSGQLMGSDKGIKIKSELLEKAQKEIDELNELEIVDPKITLDLDELEDLKLTPNDVAAIAPFLDKKQKRG